MGLVSFSTPPDSSAHFLLSPDALRLLEVVPAAIVVVHQDGNIRYANGALKGMFQYSDEELLGSSIELLLTNQPGSLDSALQSAFAGAPSRCHIGAEGDLNGRRRDGSQFPLEISLNAIATEDGMAVVATLADISQHPKLGNQIAQVVEAAPYGIVLVDTHGIIGLVNRRLLDLFGYTREELMGQSMDVLLPERYRENHASHRATYAKEPTLRTMGVGRDLTGRHRDGTEIPVEIGVNPVETEEGKMVLAAVVDITERKQLELGLRQANANLEEFTYVASHDLKSPLRGISDLIEWIGEDVGTDAPNSLLNNIDRIRLRVRRMEGLIEDLLAYARAGQRTHDCHEIDVHALITDLTDLEPVPPQFEIVRDISVTTMQASKTPLETVLRNLFSNALKHHDGQQPRIVISAHADDSYCKFSIIDNGPGIPRGAQERVFHLFQTLTASERAGTGIGLALAKRLVESHGGRIELESTDGQRGAAFHVWWPRFSRRDIND